MPFQPPKGVPPPDDDGSPLLPLGQFAVEYPAVWTMLSQTRWADGKPREVSSLLLFRQDGRAKVMIADKAQGLVAFVTGRTVDDALGVLEGQLQEGSVDWRPDRSASRKK